VRWKSGVEECETYRYGASLDFLRMYPKGLHPIGVNMFAVPNEFAYAIPAERTPPNYFSKVDSS
jgi:hypothetical protein